MKQEMKQIYLKPDLSKLYQGNDLVKTICLHNKDYLIVPFDDNLCIPYVEANVYQVSFNSKCFYSIPVENVTAWDFNFYKYIPIPQIRYTSKVNYEANRQILSSTLRTNNYINCISSNKIIKEACMIYKGITSRIATATESQSLLNIDDSLGIMLDNQEIRGNIKLDSIILDDDIVHNVLDTAINKYIVEHLKDTGSFTIRSTPHTEYLQMTEMQVLLLVRIIIYSIYFLLRQLCYNIAENDKIYMHCMQFLSAINTMYASEYNKRENNEPYDKVLICMIEKYLMKVLGRLYRGTWVSGYITKDINYRHYYRIPCKIDINPISLYNKGESPVLTEILCKVSELKEELNYHCGGIEINSHTLNQISEYLQGLIPKTNSYQSIMRLINMTEYNNPLFLSNLTYSLKDCMEEQDLLANFILNILTKSIIDYTLTLTKLQYVSSTNNLVEDFYKLNREDELSKRSKIFIQSLPFGYDDLKGGLMSSSIVMNYVNNSLQEEYFLSTELKKTSIQRYTSYLIQNLLRRITSLNRDLVCSTRFNTSDGELIRTFLQYIAHEVFGSFEYSNGIKGKYRIRVDMLQLELILRSFYRLQQGNTTIKSYQPYFGFYSMLTDPIMEQYVSNTQICSGGVFSKQSTLSTQLNLLDTICKSTPDFKAIQPIMALLSYIYTGMNSLYQMFCAHLPSLQIGSENGDSIYIVDNGVSANNKILQLKQDILNNVKTIYGDYITYVSSGYQHDVVMASRTEPALTQIYSNLQQHLNAFDKNNINREQHLHGYDISIDNINPIVPQAEPLSDTGNYGYIKYPSILDTFFYEKINTKNNVERRFSKSIYDRDNIMKSVNNTYTKEVVTQQQLNHINFDAINAFNMLLNPTMKVLNDGLQIVEYVDYCLYSEVDSVIDYKLNARTKPAYMDIKFEVPYIVTLQNSYLYKDSDFFNPSTFKDVFELSANNKKTDLNLNEIANDLDKLSSSLEPVYFGQQSLE